MRQDAVVIPTVSGQRYVVSMFGTISDWVHNLEAARGDARQRGDLSRPLRSCAAGDGCSQRRCAYQARAQRRRRACLAERRDPWGRHRRRRRGLRSDHPSGALQRPAARPSRVRHSTSPRSGWEMAIRWCDAEAAFSTESSEHCCRSLLLWTRSQQLHAEPVFGDVHWREIYRILTSDGVDIGRTEPAAFNRDPEAGVDQPAHGSRSSDTRPRRPFRCEATVADKASAVSSSSVR